MQNEEFNVHYEEVKEAVKRFEALQRLQKNKDFKFIINEGYLRDEAVRLVKMRADKSAIFNESIKNSIDNKIIGVGEFNEYLRTIHNIGVTAIAELEAYEAYENSQEFADTLVEDVIEED